ncbi:hypothetical protein AVEN_204709-1 [Araneus ventricosus]|uniref:Uncharacterized protein n=1 Tax=Araneus ventricosus TaxID=182803 RepID=A0A4Y2M3S8_ARAVE|nr:hypothetical protein AVEN_204709-1 [Araneus ventricosus]
MSAESVFRLFRDQRKFQSVIMKTEWGPQWSSGKTSASGQGGPRPKTQFHIRSAVYCACCEVLKSTRKFSHGKSDRASQVATRERPEKRADKAFPDCVIPEGLRLKFTAI